MGIATSSCRIPPGFLAAVTGWADNQPHGVSVKLFGSRARGDHRPDSDWEFAILFDGQRPHSSELPQTIDDCSVDWVAIERYQALWQRNLCSGSHAIAAVGRCVHGSPLPRPEGKGTNPPTAWDNLDEALNNLNSSVRALTS